MSRKSSLTPRQWENAANMRAQGETYRAISAFYKVPEPTVRKGIKALVDLANRKVEASLAAKKIDSEIAAMPAAKQRTVNGLAARLMEVSEHLAGAAAFGAMTAHRLSGIANAQVQLVDDGDIFSPESIKALEGVALLTKMANSSAEVGLNLMRANKDAIEEMNKPDPTDAPPKRLTYEVVR